MTLYFPDFEAIEKDRKEKEAGGYIYLDGENEHLMPAHLQERMLSIYHEALAAGLICENESLGHFKEMGVTEIGKPFFMLSDNKGYNSWKDLLIKPGMLPQLISYLNKNLQATEARAASEAYIKAEIARRLRNQKKSEAREAQHELLDLENKPAIKENESTKTIEDKKIELLNKHASHDLKKVTKESQSCSGGPASPSAIVIIGGSIALFPLAFAKVFFEGKYGSQAAEAFLIPFFVIVFGVPLFIVIRYVCKNGISESPQRFKKLMIGIAVFLIIGFVMAQLHGGGGTNCAYRIGCF